MTSIQGMGMGTAQPKPETHRLREAAQQFEAMMLGELLKPLQGSTSIDGEDSASSNGPLQAFGTEAVAGALARAGALGFADRLVHSVQQHNHLPQKSAD